MSKTRTVRAMLEADHEQVENLLHSVCHEFMAAHGTIYHGDWEDCRSEVNELYVDAHYEYDPDRGMKYSSWIRFKVWKGLMEVLRSRIASSRRRPPHCDVAVVEVGYDEPSFRLDEFMEGLSEDAKMLVDMIFRPPFDLVLAVKGNFEPLNIRMSLKGVVKDWGWTGKKIVESFNEIKEALR